MYQPVDAHWAVHSEMWNFRRQNLRQGWSAGARSRRRHLLSRLEILLPAPDDEVLGTSRLAAAGLKNYRPEPQERSVRSGDAAPDVL